MMDTPEPFDTNGNRIIKGDWVLFEEAPEVLLSDLPSKDQTAIKLQAKVPMQIVDFDQYGYVELEFIGNNDGRFHTIWIEPKYLFKIENS
jgi:hypothetical protein